MKWAPQIRLRTIFLLTFCAAVGLASGVPILHKVQPTIAGFVNRPRLSLHYGLLSAASVPIVIGLVQQIRQLARLSRGNRTHLAPFSFAVRYGIVWRAVVAATIVACLLVRMLTIRQLLELPKHRDVFWYDVFPDQLWLFCVIIVLSDSIARWQSDATSRTDPLWRRAAVWMAGTLLALILLHYAAVIAFLVHIGTANIEAAQSSYHQRLGTFPDQASEGFRLFWICLGAAGVVMLSVVARASLNRNDTWTRRAIKVCFFLILLSAAIAFCVWYYCIELRRISPDLATVGFPGNRLDWLGASMLAAFAVSAGAYRQARGEHMISVVEYAASDRDQISLHETFAFQPLLVVAAMVYLEEMLRGWFGRFTFAELIRFIFQDPTTVLCVAICALSLHLVWICWRRRNDTFDWKLPELDRRRFLWNWLGLAAIVLVGIPTISAYCFAFWLGPWYLYGD